MDITNRERIAKGLDLLRDGLRPRCEGTWRAIYGPDWLRVVNSKLRSPDHNPSPWDVAFLFKVMKVTWNETFGRELPPSIRSLVFELSEVRNRWAHQDSFNVKDTLRALDSMERLLEAFGASGQRQKVSRLREDLMEEEVERKLRETKIVIAKTRKVWNRLRTEPDPALIDLVRERVFEEVSLRPTTEQVVKVIRDSQEPVPHPSPNPPRPVPRRPQPTPAPSPSDKPTRVRLWGRDFRFPGWTRLAFGVVEALYERHGADFDRILQLRGSKHKYASLNPDDLRNPRQVASSRYYFDYVWCGDARRASLNKLLALFGYPPSDLEILYD